MNGRLIGVKLALGFVKFEANKRDLGLLAISRKVGFKEAPSSLFLAVRTSFAMFVVVAVVLSSFSRKSCCSEGAQKIDRSKYRIDGRMKLATAWLTVWA